jgi:hypothetical protein
MGVIVRILSDVDRQNSREAKNVLGAAVIDDLLGVLLLAVFNEFSRIGEISLALRRYHPDTGASVYLSLVICITNYRAICSNGQSNRAPLPLLSGQKRALRTSFLTLLRGLEYVYALFGLFRIVL